MASNKSAQSSLLTLPDPCLLEVLQCLADDQRSLFSAARAHSRLHQATVAALRTVKANLPQQQQMDSVMAYLYKHGRNLDSIDLHGCWSVSLRKLSPVLQLRSLHLDGLSVQLLHGDGPRGVLGAAASVAALKQLRLRGCRLLDEDAEVLTAALLHLPPALEHLSIVSLWKSGPSVCLPTDVLQRLQQLTYLELGDTQVEGGDEALQPLQALTRLIDLRLHDIRPGTRNAAKVTASMLSSTTCLTCLVVSGCSIEPDALADKTKLQHLQLHVAERWHGGVAECTKLLSHLQHMEQMTHLSLKDNLLAGDDGASRLAAYSALTASSKLHHLAVSRCKLPVGAWQHMFPLGRDLPYLRFLDISYGARALGDDGRAPEGSLIASCCPNLQYLDMQGLLYSKKLLTPLQGLGDLRTLHVKVCDTGDLEAVCQLTGLRELEVHGSLTAGALLPQLTQLQQLTGLTVLSYEDYRGNAWRPDQIRLTRQAPEDELLWRQLLQRQVNHPDPAIAQQAAAALAE